MCNYTFYITGTDLFLKTVNDHRLKRIFTNSCLIMYKTPNTYITVFLPFRLFFFGFVLYITTLYATYILSLLACVNSNSRNKSEAQSTSFSIYLFHLIHQHSFNHPIDLFHLIHQHSFNHPIDLFYLILGRHPITTHITYKPNHIRSRPHFLGAPTLNPCRPTLTL